MFTPQPSTDTQSGTAPIVSFLDGAEVALGVHQAISYRTILRTATIVSYNMQDYGFWGPDSLSHLLLKQLTFGALIRLVTTPPPGKATGATFRKKYGLLSNLQKNGVAVFLNEKLHAKAYLFQDEKNTTTAIVGSANLTELGFGLPHAPLESLMEMAALTNDANLFHAANSFVDTKIVSDIRTVDFATWFAKNSLEIGKAGL